MEFVLRKVVDGVWQDFFFFVVVVDLKVFCDGDMWRNRKLEGGDMPNTNCHGSIGRSG